MALVPNIPTSFVPPASQRHRHYSQSVTTIASQLAYLALAIVFFLAIGVFIYGRILSSTEATKNTALVQAGKTTDVSKVKEFVQLQNRLDSSKTLLSNHLALSGFFSLLQTIIPSNMQFSNLTVSVGKDNTTTVQGSGVAKSFNTLDAASQAFAKDGRIKDAIFSQMKKNFDGSVSFNFTATLDPSLIAYTPSAYTQIQSPAPASISAASTSAATSTPSL